LGKEHGMSDAEFPDAEFPDAALPGLDYLDQGNSDNDEDEEPVIPRDDNRPTADDPATSRNVGTAQTVTNDAVAGEPVQGAVAPDDSGTGLIEPTYADNDLAAEEIDLDDTLEWRPSDPAAPTAGDLDSPLPDYDALTDERFFEAGGAPDDSTDDRAGHS
jgi:hypothetical protein